MSSLENDGGLISTAIFIHFISHECRAMAGEMALPLCRQSGTGIYENPVSAESGLNGKRAKGRERIFKMSTCATLAKTLVRIHFKYSISPIQLNPTNISERSAVFIFHCRIRNHHDFSGFEQHPHNFYGFKPPTFLSHSFYRQESKAPSSLKVCPRLRQASSAHAPF